ncbi:hypothetical protein LTR35_002015 [Friedmanniomyces endolithicus]|nr:hypothetical protein LTS00_010323 [Friedmanniomyces endolithicus]KAK0291292.1 hypothetical protein LTR35_002015 [Friedmanniomyces endolithicus]
MWTRLLYPNSASSIGVRTSFACRPRREDESLSLTPDTVPPPYASIRGIVTLSWPYSSSTQQCALLLADPDFRLRKQKGQVRIRFTGDAAAAVARAHLGIGDEVELRLQGASWVDAVDVTRTPGRSVDGELSFGRHVELTIKRPTGDEVVKVDVPSPAPSSVWNKPAPDATPPPAASRYPRASFSGGNASAQIYSSPAFNKRSRLSGNSFLDSNYDPFQFVNVEDEQPRKKLRLSFGGVENWRYSGETPSPVKRTPSRGIKAQAGQEPSTVPTGVEFPGSNPDEAMDADEPQSNAIASKRQAEVSASEVAATQEVDAMEIDVATKPYHSQKGPEPSQSLPSETMLPPPLPRLQVPAASPSQENTGSQQDEHEQHDGPSTPKLQAVPNSALPLPSPFPSSATQENFESLQPDHSTLAADDDSSAQTFETHNDQSSETPTIDGTHPNVQSQAIMTAQETPLLEKPVGLDRALGIDVQQGTGDGDTVQSKHSLPSDVDEPHAGGELTSVAQGQVHISQTLEREAADQGAVAEHGSVETHEPERAHEVRREDQQVIQGESRKQYNGLNSLPQTPVRQPQGEPESDDAASAAVTAVAGFPPTPQSQRDKVMARTYISLFGFRTSPPPQTVSSQRNAGDVAPVARFPHSAVPKVDASDAPANEAEPTSNPVTEVQKLEAEIAGEFHDSTHTTLVIPEPGIDETTSHIPSLEHTSNREPTLTPEPKVDRDFLSEAEAGVDVYGEPQEPPPDVHHPVSSPVHNEVIDSDLQVPSDPVSVPADSAEVDDGPLHSLQAEIIVLESSSSIEDPTDEGTGFDGVEYAEAPFEEQRIEYGPIEDISEANDMFQTTLDAKEAAWQRQDGHVIEDVDDTESSVREDPAVFDNVAGNEVQFQDFVSELQDLVEPEQHDAANHSPLMTDEIDTDDSLPSPLPTSELNGFVEGILPLILTEMDSSSSPYAELVAPRRIQATLPADDYVVPSQFTPERVIEESQIDEMTETFDTQQVSLAEDSDVISVPMRGPARELSAKEAEQPRMVAFPAAQDELKDSVAHISSQSLDLQEHASASPPQVIELITSSPIEEDFALVLDTHGSPPPAMVDMLEPVRTEAATFEGLIGMDTLASSSQTQPSILPPRSAREHSQATSAPNEDGHEDEDKDHSQMTFVPHEYQNTTVAKPALPYSAELESQVPHVTADNISYPTLPLSLLQSQPIPAASFSPVQQSHQETAESAMPPTPQLTQQESDLQVAATVTFQILTLSDPQSAESRTPAVSQITREATTQIAAEVTLASTDEQLVTVTHADPNTLIGTLAQSDGAADERKTPRTSRVDHNGARVGKSARKSFKCRLSNVPDVISAWFSPKGSSGVVANAFSEQRTKHHALQVEQTDAQVSHLELRKSTSNGVSTSFGYFTTLSGLEEKLNATTHDALGNNTVDVLAVVTDSTKAPERAKGGPRDYYTIMRIVDTSQPSNGSIRVEVFRPWKAVLPVADVGDVVLLRAFSVKSKKRRAYLLSTDASSWCVWRYGDTKLGDDNGSKPVWARRSVDGRPDGMREEIKGPPVELGEEERRHAGVLREWWITVGSKVDAAEFEEER